MVWDWNMRLSKAKKVAIIGIVVMAIGGIMVLAGTLYDSDVVSMIALFALCLGLFIAIAADFYRIRKIQ